MPKSNKDTQELLDVFAAIIAKHGTYKKDYLLENLKVLDQEICKKSFNWNTVAEQTRISRHEIYRWYHDTFQRNLFGSVSHEDMQIIRTEIESALDNNVPLDRNYQTLIKAKLSKDYHRNSFTVAFNNQKKIAVAKREPERAQSRQLTTRKGEHKRRQKAEAPISSKSDMITDISFVSDVFQLLKINGI